MNVGRLMERLDHLEKSRGMEWLEGLDERKLAELRFHDKNRDKCAAHCLPADTYEKLYGNKKYYSVTRLSAEYVDGWIKENSPGKIFLDYACGDGGNAILAAQSGAALALGIDISGISVKNARESAARVGAKNARFLQADCEDTGLPDESVDLVICSGMLHHLDLSFAFPELRRILKPGGKILAGEALDYNPLIKLYRKMTPAMRTEWESAHILSYNDLEFAKRFFELGEIRHWHLLSIAGARVPKLLPWLERADRLLLKLPGVRMMSWIFTFELLKKQEN